MFGSDIIHDQHTHHNVEPSITHSTNNITCDFRTNYTFQPTICTNYCICTCCHNTDIPRSQCIIFKESNYNLDNTVVVEALSNRFSTPTSAECICKKCHKDLLQEIMPMNSVALCIKLTSHTPQQTCIHCNTVPTGKYLTFDKTKYGENTIVSQMTEKDQQHIICNKCHNAICKETLVTCLRCTNTITKICTLKFDINRYTSLEQHIKDMAKSHKTNCYICKSCHEELQQKLTCVCCNRPMQKQICKIYNKEDYNFSYFVVSQCLQHLPNSTQEVQYICMSCDKALKQTSDEDPCVPYHTRNANAVTGAKFLKALNQKPEYVCTCCHHMLFCKTVQLFHITDYDMNNDTVKACLSHVICHEIAQTYI